MPMCVETATQTPLPFLSRSYGEHAVETTCTSAQYMRLRSRYISICTVTGLEVAFQVSRSIIHIDIPNINMILTI